jgi:hypothetical protein
MAWTVYSKPIEVLSATDINNIKENIRIIRNLLIGKDVLVGDIKDFQASESTQFIEMFDILSNIEYTTSLDKLLNIIISSIRFKNSGLNALFNSKLTKFS